MNKINSILVAVDLSEISVEALRFAVQLSEQLQAGLKVVYTLPESSLDLPAEGSAEFNHSLVDKELEKTRDALDQFVKENSGGNAEIEQHVSLGEPELAVNKIAEQIEPDMIVVGTHGRTGLSHLLMGSVAESIVRSSRVPVVCVRHQG